MIQIEYEYSTGRLELRDETKGKRDFWMGELKGRTVTIHFGKIGTLGHTGARDFKTNQEARDFLDKRLKQKTNEGFQRV